MNVKLCGMRRIEDIYYANEALPDLVGFVFAKSRRQVTKEQAAELKIALDPRIETAGVFVNEQVGVIADIANAVGLDVVQLHGDESNAFIAELRILLPQTEIWKAIRVSGEQSLRDAAACDADCLLLDAFSKNAYGGTGETADWELLNRFKASFRQPFFLAGGLNAQNIAQAMRNVQPFGVDLSSGIETDGVKDRAKMLEVMRIVRGTGGTFEDVALEHP